MEKVNSVASYSKQCPNAVSSSTTTCRLCSNLAASLLSGTEKGVVQPSHAVGSKKKSLV